MSSNAYKHGDSKTHLYNSWCGMLQRCHNSKHHAFRFYGGRGIVVYPEWLEFIPFRDWAISSGYKEGLTIDRIDNDGNYEPDNCQWITREVNTSKDCGKPIYQFDTEGNLLSEYVSIMEAERQTGINNTNIVKCCKNKRKTAGNFVWSYKEEQHG